MQVLFYLNEWALHPVAGSNHNLHLVQFRFWKGFGCFVFDPIVYYRTNFSAIFDQEMYHWHVTYPESYALRNVELFNFHWIHMEGIYRVLIRRQYSSSDPKLLKSWKLISEIFRSLWCGFCSIDNFGYWLWIADGYLLPPWSSKVVFLLRNFRNQRWSQLESSRHALLSLAAVC